MRNVLFVFITILSLLCSACGTSPLTESDVKVPVTIAVIDTGFSSAAIPPENIIEGKNYLDDTLSTEDTYGHGTAIASVILDVCPDALLVPLVSNVYDD